MFTNKVVIALVIFAALSCFVSAEESCNKLLHCQECKDESHCKSCPTDYILDSDDVCRYDCATKFGVNCTSCSEKKCFCPNGEEWNSKAGACVRKEECTTDACDYCGNGYDLVDVSGKCNTCAEVFGTGCKTCSFSKCLTTVDSTYEIRGAVAVKTDCNSSCPSTCSELFPGCANCSSDLSSCLNCSDSAVADGKFCKFKFPTCTKPKKILHVDNKFVCSFCNNSFDSACIPTMCSARACTGCKTGFGLTDKGTCVNCSNTFEGCGLCTGEYCTKCRSSSWVLTPEGCFNQSPYVPPSESNGGLIAGIVIACIVLVAIIVLAVYCIITSNAKKGQVDPSIYEDDSEFKSMSVL